MNTKPQARATDRYEGHYKMQNGEAFELLRSDVFPNTYVIDHPDWLTMHINALDVPEFLREVQAKFTKHIARSVVAALALTITSPAHAAPPTFELPLHPPDTYLAGCAIMVHDDGTRLATCDEDGAVLVFDVDGNRFVNEAGAPIRAAGWYVLE